MRQELKSFDVDCHRLIMLILSDFVIVIIAISITIVFCVIGVCATCFCCCYTPFEYLYRSSHFNFMRKREAGVTESTPAYQIMSGYHTTSPSYEKIEPSAPPLSLLESESVDAFLVAPLVAINEKSEQHYNPYSSNKAIASPLTHEEVSSVSGQSTHRTNTSKFKDVWAAVLFIINVIVLIYFGIKSANSISIQASMEGTDTMNWNALGALSTLALGLTMMALIVTYIWLSFLLKFAESLIEIVLKANIALVLVSSILSLLWGNLIGFIFLLVCGVMNIWYYFSVRARIPFASAVLNTASEGTKQHFSGIMLTAFLMLTFQLIWVSLWAVASYGISNDPTYFSKHKSAEGNDDGLNGLQIGLIFVMLVSLYWGIQTIKYVLQTTVAGTV